MEQRDRWTDKQTDGQTDRQTAYGLLQVYLKKAIGQNVVYTCCCSRDLLAPNAMQCTPFKTDRQTDRQTNRQTDRQTNILYPHEGVVVLRVHCLKVLDAKLLLEHLLVE